MSSTLSSRRRTTPCFVCIESDGIVGNFSARQHLPIVGEQAQDISAFVDAVNVMLNGVYFTIEAALPALLEHGEGRLGVRRVAGPRR